MTHEAERDHEPWDDLPDARDVPVTEAPEGEVGTIDPDAEYEAMLAHDRRQR